MYKISFVFLLASFFQFSGVYAQIAKNDAANKELYNPQSTNPVRKDDIMFKKSLWFRMDLRTKVNAPLFANNNEISRLLVEAVKNDMIKPYKNDSLSTAMSKEEFLSRLKIPMTDNVDDDIEWENENPWGDETEENVELGPDEYLPRQLYVLEMKEDMIFDKRESRMKHDILALTIVIPADQTPTGIDKVLASFSYKELANSLFKNNPNAIWYNPQNAGAHMNLADAFTLRLPDGMLVKYENPRDNRIVDLYGDSKRSLIEAQNAVMQLMEYEALLWEY
ncbi:gliding motility protein GldN [Chondrinema litorale]|uniref:type IX secretion system ring protein PorN/GldN n=1 Tax=Chondrinema litorale TaxID=2994555 RepID=UPI0025434382|nr:gliding motility protein GldN [Chondrinema litorale]UZR93749.1 gliding motility protein GldN [Chondrinema litorale]